MNNLKKKTTKKKKTPPKLNSFIKQGSNLCSTKPLTRVRCYPLLPKVCIRKLVPQSLPPAGSETSQSHSGAGRLPKDASLNLCILSS